MALRWLTVTLWTTIDDMNAARIALGPVVQEMLDPAMTAPTKRYGTAEVIFTDIRL